MTDNLAHKYFMEHFGEPPTIGQQSALTDLLQAAYARGLADGRQLGEDEARIAYDLFLGRSGCRVIDGLPPSAGKLATMPGEVLDDTGAVRNVKVVTTYTARDMDTVSVEPGETMLILAAAEAAKEAPR